MHVGIDTPGSDDEPVGIDHDGAGSDDNVDVIGYGGVACPADAADATLADSDRGNPHSIDRVEHDGIGDHQIAGLPRGHRRQPDSIATCLGESDVEFIACVGDALGDTQAQTGRTEADHVTGLWAVVAHEGVPRRSATRRATALSAWARSLTSAPPTTSR